MSLIVSIIPKNEDYNVKDLEKEIKYPRNKSFGFESWRQALWGHDIIKALGCEVVCLLSKTNIYVFDAEVDNLKEDLLKILSHIEKVAKQSNIDKTSIEFRLRNALKIIRIVEKNLHSVGVAIE